MKLTGSSMVPYNQEYCTIIMVGLLAKHNSNNNCLIGREQLEANLRIRQESVGNLLHDYYPDTATDLQSLTSKFL